MPTKAQLCPMLLCDVVGSSNIPDGTPKEAVAAFLDTVKRDCQARYDILHVNDTGDGFLLVGTNPSEIAEAGLRIRDEFRRHNWKRAGFSAPIDVRIGLHQQTITIIEEDGSVARVTGSGVDRTARIEQAGEAGRVFCSAIIASQLCEDDSAHIRVSPLGIRQLPKGAGEIELFELAWEHDDGASRTEAVPAPEPQTSPAVRSIPRPATDLEINSFLDGAFLKTIGFFRLKLEELTRSDPDHVHTELDVRDTHRFAARVYVNGDIKAQCRVWKNDGSGFQSRGIFYGGDGIATAMDENSYNEHLSIEDNGRTLAFKPIMAFYPLVDSDELLDENGAAAFLWQTFHKNLS